MALTWLDRVALPLFVTALVVSRLLAPKPEWVLYDHGEEIGRQPFRSLEVDFPPLSAGNHYIEAHAEVGRVEYVDGAQFSQDAPPCSLPNRIRLEEADTAMLAPRDRFTLPLAPPSRQPFLMLTFDGCRVRFRRVWGHDEFLRVHARDAVPLW